MSKNTPLDFQSATAKHVLEAFKNNQRRVLVADEAGLGKTTVASEVVRLVKTELKKEVLDDDGLYCIVYVCCNLQIAQQNIDTLTDDAEKVDLGQSRLSMQHFVYHKKKAELQASNKNTLVLSLTPATSFQMTWGTGSANERALMYSCIALLPEYESDDKRIQLSDVFVGKAKVAWEKMSNHYYNEVRNDNMQEYRDSIIEKLKSKLSITYSGGLSIKDYLLALCNRKHDEQWEQDCSRIIMRLRKIFADISLEVLKPDLVIMDEFQKFSSLINTEEETEETMIARKFFSNKDTFILLLSATPYKPYTTLEELNENNNDEQYRDFHRLMTFLYDGNGKELEFKNVWRDYSSTLNHLDTTAIDSLKEKHQQAEQMLYGVMGRTERSNTGIFTEPKAELDEYITADDVRAFIQMQHLIDNCRMLGKKVYSAPADYTKSSAYQLSFMDNYKLKETISEAWQLGAGKGIKSDCLLLDKKKINNYGLSRYCNGRLNYVIDSIFGKGKDSTNVEQLLWVPASHPYYTQKANVFTKNALFSKYLAFSSWGMVPKMIACLVSYEAERRLYSKAYKQPEYKNKDDDYAPLKDDEGKSRAKSILVTVCEELAGLYNPEEFYGKDGNVLKDLKDIRAVIVSLIKAKLTKYDANEVNRISSLDIYQLMQAFDNEDVQPRNIAIGIENVLADIAIGSPANCLYRSFKQMGDPDAKFHAEEVAKELVKIFNNRYGVAAVRSTVRQEHHYFLKVIEYCIEGNLQAVLDEFVHMIGKGSCFDKMAERIIESFASSYPQQVNTSQTFGSDERFSMRKHFAVDFGSGKQTEKEVNHSINVRSAFNSPFRPFVLASTSVGQEGLDFHWYCRKMIHWNLPSNPQNMEQREGRINRFKCLAVRRNIAKLYKNIYSWDKIFEKAKEELKQDNPDMVPFWYLPLNDEMFQAVNEPLEYIERIVPMYPLSEDKSRYERLIKVLSLYRLTMGQPRQEELIQLLDGKLNKEEMDSLLFDLSPFNHNKKNKLNE